MTAGLKQGQRNATKSSGLVETMGREERHMVQSRRSIQSSLPRVEREEQVREISELKKALTRTRQELQRTRDINRSSSDEEGGYSRGEGMSRSGSLTGLGSRSGSINCLSSKPSLNRELVSKLRSMTETIKMLSTENVVLREENDGLIASQAKKAGDAASGEGQEEKKLNSLMETYENQIQELVQKVLELESQVETTRQSESGPESRQTEKDKYKSLARRLKEERNNYREMVVEKRKEQDALKGEMENMTEIIGELRKNCSQLQDELLYVQQESPGPRREISVQTSPRVRRASLGDISRHNLAGPKRSQSTMTAQSLSRQQQHQQKINKLSKPKPRVVGSLPGSLSKGPKIAKPVTRPGVGGRKSSEPLSCKTASPATPRRASEGSTPSSPRIHTGTYSLRSSAGSGPPSPRTPSSRIPGPSPSKIPTPSRIISRLPKVESNRSPGSRSPGTATVSRTTQRERSSSSSSLVLRTSDRVYTTTSEEETVLRMEIETRKSPQRNEAMDISDERSLGEEEEVLRIVEDTDIQPTGDDFDALPPPDQLKAEALNNEEYDNDDGHDVVDEFPAPPPPEHLAKLSMEAQLRIVSETVERACDRMLQGEEENTTEPDTPRTTRKVENMKQRLAARRIQRTWKHFYQELEEKRADDESSFRSLPPFPSNQAQEEDTDTAISNIQASILGDGRRGRGLTFLREGSFDASRARGGIYTARPWVVTSESDSEEEDISTVQGIVRSHSFRLGTITEGDVASPAKVSSIRAKFNRPAPDGESDCAAEGR